MDFSTLGQKNFLYLVLNRLKGRLHSLSDAERVLHFLIGEIKKVPLPPITGMELFLADGCNLDCTYCFEGRKPKRFLSLELAKLAVKRLVAEWSEGSGRVHFALFGGEPLLNWQVCRQVIEYAEELASSFRKQSSFYLTTNGTLLNRERTQFLKEHQVAVMLSMDGVPAAHNKHRRTKEGQPSFHLAWRGLELLREYFETFDVRMTVMPDTAPLLFESILFLSEQGVKRIIALPALGVQWRPEDWQVYQQQVCKVVEYFNHHLTSTPAISLIQEVERAKQMLQHRAKNSIKSTNFQPFGCYAGIGSVAVTASGEIFPCSAFVGDEQLRSSYQLGRLQEGQINRFRRQELKVLMQHRGDKCLHCPIRGFCLGSCLVTNYYATGYLVEPAPTTCWGNRLYVNLAKQEAFTSTCSIFPQTSWGEMSDEVGAGSDTLES